MKIQSRFLTSLVKLVVSCDHDSSLMRKNAGRCLKGVVAVCLLLSISPSGVLAESGMKIGFVNLEKALQDSDAGQEAQKQYEKEVKAASQKIQGKKDEFKKLQDRFSDQKDSLNAQAAGKKKEELLSVKKDLERSYQDAQDTLQRRNGQLVGELVVKLRKIVKEIGDKEGYTFILEGGEHSVLFVDKSVDITSEVVARFNEEK